MINSATDDRTRERIGPDIREQLDALDEELGDWTPGQRWLNELRDSLIKHNGA